ncbi:MAG TPA: hypothetical protein VGD67_21800 [Pseudonocardiaceae bacterium]
MSGLCSLTVAAVATTAAVAARIWAVAQPHIPLAGHLAALLTAVAVVAWVAVIMDVHHRRLLRRLNQLRGDREAATYLQAVGVDPPPGPPPG